MQRSLLTLILLFSTYGFAHSTTDWREDKKAFDLVQDAPLSRTPLKPSSVNLPPISAEYLKQKLLEFTGEVSVTIDGKSVKIPDRGSTLGRHLALKYLMQEYKVLGFATSTEAFSGGSNFVAERAGTDPSKFLILSSHVDSVDNAGANDDGSGTIGALAIAKALQKFNTKYTLRIVGFDREEDGLVGSRAYVRGITNRSSFIGNIHLEMMAYHGRKDGRFHLIDCDRAESRFLTDKVMNAIGNLKLPLIRTQTCTNASDHASFWRSNLPAIVLSENFFGGDGDPCYHSACDRVDSRMDWDYLIRILTSVGYAVADLIEAR